MIAYITITPLGINRVLFSTFLSDIPSCSHQTDTHLTLTILSFRFWQISSPSCRHEVRLSDPIAGGHHHAGPSRRNPSLLAPRLWLSPSGIQGPQVLWRRWQKPLGQVCHDLQWWVELRHFFIIQNPSMQRLMHVIFQFCLGIKLAHEGPCKWWTCRLDGDKSAAQLDTKN